MDRLLSHFQYTPVPAADRDTTTSTARPFTQNLRGCLSSKAFLRTLLVILSLLLAVNLFFPARDQLEKYGYIKPADKEAYLQGNAEGSEILDEALPSDGSVNWSQYAYCQYVTSKEYLCNSLMIFESLIRLNARAERLMLYPEEWMVGDESITGQLLAKARDEYGVRLVPIVVQRFNGEATWAESFTKLLAFNQTEYKRVLSLDSDSTVLQPMDELFLLPSAPVAMPRAYWLDRPYLSSQLVLVEPSTFEFNRVEAAFSDRSDEDFDMEIVNNLYGTSCFIIPHRKYDLVTGEFKAAPEEHWKYLGSQEEEWDPDKVFAEAKFLHFSDWPYPKPWIETSEEETKENMPQCRGEDGQDCRDQQHWLNIYQDFRERRRSVCGVYAKRDEVSEIMRPRREEHLFRWR